MVSVLITSSILTVFQAVNALSKSWLNWIKSESEGLIPALFPSQELNLMGFYSRQPTWSPRRNCWPWTQTRRTCNLSMRSPRAPSTATWRTNCSLAGQWLPSHRVSTHELGFPGGLDCKEFTCNSETQVWSLEWEDPSGEGKGNPLQYSCLENPMDEGAWQATVHGVSKSWIWLSN